MNLDQIEVEKIVCSCNAGAHVDLALREAMIMALTEDRIVEFKHNDRIYRVDPRNLIEPDNFKVL